VSSPPFDLPPAIGRHAGRRIHPLAEMKIIQNFQKQWPTANCQLSLIFDFNSLILIL
jgi:hypothetical protein